MAVAEVVHVLEALVECEGLRLTLCHVDVMVGVRDETVSESDIEPERVEDVLYEGTEGVALPVAVGDGEWDLDDDWVDVGATVSVPVLDAVRVVQAWDTVRPLRVGVIDVAVILRLGRLGD